MNLKKPILLKLFATLFACTSIILFSPARADDSATLVFSAIPDQDESQLKARFNKIAEYLSDTLEIPVEYVPVKSYAAAVTSFRNNQLQLCLLYTSPSPRDRG